MFVDETKTVMVMQVIFLNLTKVAAQVFVFLDDMMMTPMMAVAARDENYLVISWKSATDTIDIKCKQ